MARSVKPIDIAKERDPQIDQVLRHIENAKPSHKRLFQTLPNHLRRRAMSYDLRRIPKPLRNQSTQTQVTAAATVKARNKPPGRDGSRFRPHGVNQAMHRNASSKWLETHLWHAKRFHMADLWGWKIPMAPTMKQTRSLIRATADSCVMRDVSFYSVVSVSQPHAVITARLCDLMRPNSHLTEERHLLFRAELFTEFPGAPIGPAELFWVSPDQLWVIVHPLLRDTIVDALSTLGPEVIDGELNFFELFGPTSGEVIRNVLQPIETTPPEVAKVVAGLPMPAAAPPGFCIGYVSVDPRSVVADVPDGEFGAVEWDSPLFRDRQQFSVQTDAEFNRERAKLLFPKSALPSGDLPVIIMQRFAVGAFGTSWLVATSFGGGHVVFKQLVRRGVRVLGLECARLIDLEAERFGFPFDRPETIDGLTTLTAEVLQKTAENNRRPPAKRLSFSFYELPANFFVGLDNSELAYARCRISMVKRGTPTRLGLICLPVEDDYARFDKLVEITGERIRVGIVLSGCSSLLAGHGKGIGLVSAQCLLGALDEAETAAGFTTRRRPKNAWMVMFREQNSQFFHPAWVSLHESTLWQ